MKQLRKTIRKILLENQEYYEKIVKLLFTEELANINQALELADAIGYISNLEYRVDPAHQFTQELHEWKFLASEELMDVISKQYPRNNSKGFSLRSSNIGGVVVKLYVNQ